MTVKHFFDNNKHVKIGIPNALLYHTYKVLWLEFFKSLGIEVIVSPETNKQIINLGSKNCIDEACFSSKIYIGHVTWLTDKCDMVFVPRYENTAIREDYCTRIIGLYDLVRNTFPNIKLLHADTNYMFRKREQDAFIKIGEALGKQHEETLAAYTNAVEKFKASTKAATDAQTALAKSGGTKVLLVTHSYNSQDSVVGKNVADFFKAAGIKILHANIIDSSIVKEKMRAKYGTRIYWKVNAELLAGVEHYKNDVDGIVLLSTFPCGPDSIFNEMIIRQLKDKPVLNLMIDELNATAGLVTRLESFTDILEAKRSGA